MHLFSYISIISIVLVIIFSWLQSLYDNSEIISIVNNITICVATGCIVALLQAVVGFNASKRESVLNFYNACVTYEKKIYNHSVIGRGFSFAKQGFKEINDITLFFDTALKPAFLLIDVSNSKDEVIVAVKKVYNQYISIHKKYVNMEIALGEAVDFAEMSDDEIIENNIDEKEETNKHNEKLKAKFDEVLCEYGDKAKYKILTENMKILEKFLFSIH